MPQPDRTVPGEMPQGAEFPPSTRHGRRFMAVRSVPLKMMRFSRWLLWLLLYAGGTFAWMVFFEHGAGWDRFQAGAKVEFERAWAALQWWLYGKAGF